MLSSFKNDWLIRLVEVRLLRGALKQASAEATQALDGTRARGERGREAGALRILAEILSRSEPPDYDSAESHFSRAMEVATALGMRPLAAHCHLGLGTLYHSTARHEQAHEHLTTATTMYREMGMTYWLDKAKVRELG